eukprot:8083483-Pyramimonas_sp.AAC.1
MAGTQRLGSRRAEAAGHGRGPQGVLIAGLRARALPRACPKSSRSTRMRGEDAGAPEGHVEALRAGRSRRKWPRTSRGLPSLSMR